MNRNTNCCAALCCCCAILSIPVRVDAVPSPGEKDEGTLSKFAPPRKLVAKSESDSPKGYRSRISAKDTAIETTLEAIEEQRKLGTDKIQLANMYEALAKRQSESGDARAAVKTYENILSLRTASSINDSRLLATTYDTFAEYLRSAQRMPEAEQYRKKALAVWEANPGSDEINLINGLSSIIYFYQQQPAKAAPYVERRTIICLKRNPKDMGAAESLAKIYMELKNYAKAEPWLEKWYTMRESEGRSRGPSYVNSDLIPIAVSLCEAESSLGKIAEAERHINLAKRYYETNSNSFVAFGEIYPEHFLEVYTMFLLKAGRVAECTEFNNRLKSLRARIQKACLGCGMG